eukprot:gene22797-31094_t
MASVIFNIFIIVTAISTVWADYAYNSTLGNPTQVSLAFYYDYFAGRDAYTNSLAIPSGVETIFGGNDGNGPTPPPGAGSSMRVKPSDTCSTAGECITYDNVINWLNQYNYVHIDEISYNHPCPECASVIRQVGDAGYKGRIIVFFRYAYSGKGLESQSEIISLSKDGYIRKIFFEVYPATHSDCSNYLCTSTSSSACTRLGQWNSAFASYYPGSNLYMAPFFGLISGIELDQCSSDMSALTTFFSCMHQIQADWKGAAFYGASSCTGCSSYTVQTAAQHCGGLLSWWNGK